MHRAGDRFPRYPAHFHPYTKSRSADCARDTNSDSAHTLADRLPQNCCVGGSRTSNEGIRYWLAVTLMLAGLSENHDFRAARMIADATSKPETSVRNCLDQEHPLRLQRQQRGNRIGADGAPADVEQLHMDRAESSVASSMNQTPSSCDLSGSHQFGERFASCDTPDRPASRACVAPRSVISAMSLSRSTNEVIVRVDCSQSIERTEFRKLRRSGASVDRRVRPLRS